MTVVLDAGALIGLERNDRRMAEVLAIVRRDRLPVRVPAAVVAQVWRDGSRQAALARLLAGAATVGLDDERSRSIGGLLARSGTADVVDASVIDCCVHGDTVVTSDRDEIRVLARAAGVEVSIIKV